MALSKSFLLFLLMHFAACDAAEMTEFRIDSRPGQPALADGVFYVGSESGAVHSVDAATQQVLWRFQAGGPVFHAPLVAGDLVLVGSNDGQLRALDKTSGELAWSFQAGDVDWETRDIFINGVPTVIDGIAYFSSEDFNLYAVELATGKEVWRHSLGEEPQALRIPVVDGVAYIGAWDGHMYAIDLDSGETAWQSRTDDSGRAALSEQVPFVTAVPIVTDEHVYFTDWSGNLFCVERATGQQVWRFDPKTANSRHAGSRSFISEYGDVIYYSTLEDHHLYGVDSLTGEAVWQMQTDGVAYGPRPLGDGLGLIFEFVQAGSGGGAAPRMHVMDFDTREFLWTASDAVSPASFVDGVVYYGSGDGSIRGRDVRTGDITYRSAPE